MNNVEYQMGGKILNAKVISDEEPVITQDKSVEITENGITLVEPDRGYNAMTTVEITTNVNPTLESKSIENTENGTVIITPSTGNYGLSSVEITTNVNPPLESKTIEFTENGTATITPTEGKYGLSSVEVTVNTPYIPDLEKDVNFFDYDGTLIEAYTKEEFLALNELPTVPTHARLSNGAWNWTLSQAKDFVTENNWLDIGATYDITSGKSEMDITITPITGKTIKIYTDGTKDWGDGTTDTNTSHTYSDYGNYTIVYDGVVNKANNSLNIFGETYQYANISNCLINLRTQNFNGSYCLYAYCSNLKSIVLSNDFVFGQSILNGCNKLKFIVLRGNYEYYIQNGMGNCNGLEKYSVGYGTEITKNGIFTQCANLKRAIQYCGSSNASNVFSGCINLKKVIIPSNSKNLGSAEFYNCMNLEEIKFPQGVSFYSNTPIFNSCISLKKLDFTSCTSIPTISENTFYGININTKIVVPDNLYSSWIVATNWSNYAESIVRESDYQE